MSATRPPTLYLYGTSLPPRATSPKRSRPKMPPRATGRSNQRHPAQRPPARRSVPNAIGLKLDALGIPYIRMAALLACHHDIPATAATVHTWSTEPCHVPRDHEAVAVALAFELSMDVGAILEAWGK